MIFGPALRLAFPNMPRGKEPRRDRDFARRLRPEPVNLKPLVVHVQNEEEPPARMRAHPDAGRPEVQTRIVGIREAIDRVALIGPVLAGNLGVVQAKVLFFGEDIPIRMGIDIGHVDELHPEEPPEEFSLG